MGVNLELFNEVQGMIGKRLSIDPQKVTREAHLCFDLGADSLAILTLSAEFSNKYGIHLPGEDILETGNIDELVTLIETRLGTQQ